MQIFFSIISIIYIIVLEHEHAQSFSVISQRLGIVELQAVFSSPVDEPDLLHSVHGFDLLLVFIPGLNLTVVIMTVG